MSELKFYRTKSRPTVILGRDWAEERDQLDAMLKQQCGTQARWTRIMAFGDVANQIYYLFKRGHRKFIFDEISFKHDYGNVWTINLETNVVFEERTVSPV